jgi:rSAM/selenodomain-associated transferase 1
MKTTRIILFAKAPVAGRVKTRLIPALGATGAATLARRMLDHALSIAGAADFGSLELCASPAPSHPDWQNIPLPAGIETSDQGDGDLGMRMARAAQRGMAGGQNVLLIGADCPALSAQHLRDAAVALHGHENPHDAVLLPARDGGYLLLGLKTHAASLFEDMPWSSAQVAELTLARMSALGWRVAVLEPLPDIDRPEDLIHLPAAFRAEPFVNAP